MPDTTSYHTHVTSENLKININEEIDSITTFIRDTMATQLRRRGAIIALSGGIDSSVTAALCARALGPEKVIGILMPEIHSSSDTSRLAKLVAMSLGIRNIEHNITPILEATGCYQRQDEAIKSLFPSYQHGNPFKIVLPIAKYRIFSLVVQDSSGAIHKERLTHDTYLQLVAATNYKQRVRKMLEYYYADRFNYAVAGSPNRLEFDQGFFVKSGDGTADFKPIVHLYKSQVYAIAAQLGIPNEICMRPPTTDTYPMEQSQEEFYFSLPYQKMDICLFAKNAGYPPESVCQATGLSSSEAQAVFTDIETKRRTTRYLHLKPLMVKHFHPGETRK